MPAKMKYTKEQIIDEAINVVDKRFFCAILQITITDKSIDEEEYMLIRMNREKMAGENFREGSMEVAFELWIEQRFLSRLQRRFPPLSREAISELRDN